MPINLNDAGNAPPGPAEPLPPLPWPNLPAIVAIARERGMAEQFSENGHAHFLEQVKRAGWTRQELENYLQHGAKDRTEGNLGIFPILPQVHSFAAGPFEDALDEVEVEIKLANRALRNGDAAAFDEHRANAQTAAQILDQMMTPDPSTPLDIKMVNPRLGRGYTRGVFDATVLAGTAPPAWFVKDCERVLRIPPLDPVVEWASAHLTAAAKGTVGLRSPDIHRQDDDADYYAPFGDPFTYG